MDSFRHVLIPVDFSSGSTSALAFAGVLARRTTRLSLLHVYPHSGPVGAETFYAPPVTALDDETRASLLERLRALSVPLRDGARDVDVVVREGDPAAEILARAEHDAVDLVVMGRHGRHGIDRLILGSVTEYVAPRAPCSVLGVRPFAGGTLLPPDLSSLLCAVDLTPSSDETLERSVSVARETGAGLTLLHVIESWRWEGTREEVRRVLSESAHERLSQLVARHGGSGGRIDTRIAFGRPKEEIVRAAQQCGADLLVGAHSRGKGPRFFFGSTAQRVMSTSPCSVLIARPSSVQRDRDAYEEKADAAVPVS